MCRTTYETSTNSFAERDFLEICVRPETFPEVATRAELKERSKIKFCSLSVFAAPRSDAHSLSSTSATTRRRIMSGRTRVLGLYRSLLRESNKVTHYNMREYSLRSVRTRFRENIAERKQRIKRQISSIESLS